MVAFATIGDLEQRLGRSFAGTEEQVQVLLDDASALLRDVIGQNVYPATASTFVGYPSGGRLDLPQWPVVSVDSVTRADEAVSYTYRPGYLKVGCDDPVDVTFTWGYEDAPAELVRLTCVLVSQALLLVEAQLGLSAGGLSSVAIDDFKLAWADAGEGSGMTLTEHAEASIRQRYGQRGATVGESSR